MRQTEPKSEHSSRQAWLATDEPRNEIFNQPNCICGVSCLGKYRRWFLHVNVEQTEWHTREEKEPAGLYVVDDTGAEAAGSSFMCCNLLQFWGTSIIPKDGIRGALRSASAFWHRVLRRRPHPGRRRCQSDAWLLSWALGGKSCLTSPQ